MTIGDRTWRERYVAIKNAEMAGHHQWTQPPSSPRMARSWQYYRMGWYCVADIRGTCSSGVPEGRVEPDLSWLSLKHMQTLYLAGNNQHRRWHRNLTHWITEPRLHIEMWPGKRAEGRKYKKHYSQLPNNIHFRSCWYLVQRDRISAGRSSRAYRPHSVASQYRQKQNYRETAGRIHLPERHNGLSAGWSPRMSSSAMVPAKGLEAVERRLTRNNISTDTKRNP